MQKITCRMLFGINIVCLAVAIGGCCPQSKHAENPVSTENQPAITTEAPVSTESQPAPPTEASPENINTRPYADHPNAEAIEKGLIFVRDHGKHTPPSWQVYAMLHFLYHRFGLAPEYAIENTFVLEGHPEHDLKMVSLVERLVNPDYVAPQERIENESEVMMRLMGRALYCDRYPVDEAFFSEWESLCDLEKQKKGYPGYIASHAILCYQWLRELGCDQNFPKLKPQWPDFANTLVEIVATEKAQTDLSFESIALLYYIGAADTVQEPWIQTLLSLQSPEGAWAYRPGDSAHGHPTVLAVWALLEHALLDQPKKPWLKSQ